jgi:hypothetical protein
MLRNTLRFHLAGVFCRGPDDRDIVGLSGEVSPGAAASTDEKSRTFAGPEIDAASRLERLVGPGMSAARGRVTSDEQHQQKEKKMKKIVPSKKLKLSRQSIRKLEPAELHRVAGAGGETYNCCDTVSGAASLEPVTWDKECTTR